MILTGPTNLPTLISPRSSAEYIGLFCRATFALIVSLPPTKLAYAGAVPCRKPLAIKNHVSIVLEFKCTVETAQHSAIEPLGALSAYRITVR